MKLPFKTVFSRGHVVAYRETNISLLPWLWLLQGSGKISGISQCHELLPLPRGLCTPSNSHSSQSVSYDWKYHMGWQSGTVIKWWIFQLLPTLCYIKWQSTINFKIKSWHEWLYSNKWTTKTFNAHIKNNPAITFQLYFIYFQATKHSWQLFMKRD